MKIKSLHITNFRGIESKTVNLDTVNAILGPCGAGKSTVIAALKFVLTGDFNKNDIKVGTKQASVEAVFEDGNSICRIRKTEGTTCKTNGKSCTATALNEYIKGKIGASTKVISSMCGTEFFESIEQKELTKFVLSVLPVSISFDKLLEFIEIHNKSPLTDEQTSKIREYFPEKEMYELKDVENAYTAAYDRRRDVNSMLKPMMAKASFEGTLPKESKEELEESLSKILLLESKAKEFEKLSKEYEKAVILKSTAEKKLEELKKHLENFKDVEKPKEEDFEKNKSDKKKFEDAIKKSNQIVATNQANIQMFQRTLDNLDKPVCPISDKLICNTDKSGLKQELSQLISKNQQAVNDTQTFIERCQEQIKMRDTFMNAYNDTLVKYTQKQSLEKQIAEFTIPTLPEKPVAIKQDDVAVQKADINNKLSLIMQYEIAEKSKKEYEQLSNELKVLEFCVSVLDVKTGVRNFILKKTIEPLQALVNQKSQTLRENFKVNLTSEKGLDIKIAPNGKEFVPMHSVSAGEFIFTTYLIMSVISKITGARILLIDNIDKLDSDSLEAFVKLICEDIEFDNVILSGINHDDTARIISETPVNVIEL